MRKILFAFAMALASAGNAAEPVPGKLKGGEIYTLPEWFKQSFLDFPEDVAEASKQGKHVMVFLHLDECPYCARMLKENFVAGDTRAFMQKHFDVIAVNVRGGTEVTWTDGAKYTERTLTRQLRSHGTPTLVFLDPQGKVVLKMTGYRDPHTLRVALEYVQTRSYREQTYAAYVASRDKSAVYAMRGHPQFQSITYLKGYRKPLAVLFEDARCAECARFHEKTLAHPDVVEEMKKITFIRLDTDSPRPIVDLEGKTMTAGQWAQALKLSDRPALVLFDDGREVYRAEGILYHFHFKEALRYASGGYYKQFGSPGAYNAARRQELLRQGVDIDYSE